MPPGCGPALPDNGRENLGPVNLPGKLRRLLYLPGPSAGIYTGPPQRRLRVPGHRGVASWGGLPIFP